MVLTQEYLVVRLAGWFCSVDSAIFGGRTLHKFSEDLRVIAGTVETDAACNFGNGQIGTAQKRKTFLDTIVEEEIKRCLMHRCLE